MKTNKLVLLQHQSLSNIIEFQQNCQAQEEIHLSSKRQISILDDDVIEVIREFVNFIVQFKFLNSLIFIVC